MRLDEWRAVLATEPATPNQRGVIMAEFERLGYGLADRAERLAVCAVLLGLDELGSTAHLSMGQAGQLYSQLRGIADRRDLLARAGLSGEDQGQGPPAVATLAEAIRDLLVLICATMTASPAPKGTKLQAGTGLV